MFSLPRWPFASAIFLAFPAAFYLNKSISLSPIGLKSISTDDDFSLIDFNNTPVYTNASLNQVTCIPQELSLSEKLCIYTSPTFWHGRGLSIFTTPAVQTHLLSLPAFTDPTLHLPPRKSLPPYKKPPGGSEYPYYIAPLPGKGMSVLASSIILPGEEILSEHPVILNKVINAGDFRPDTAHLWPEFNETLVDSLPIRSQKEVKALAATVGGPDFLSSALATNSFLVEIDRVSHVALFPMVSRLNHDCRPNVAYIFSRTSLTMSLRSLRRIEADEELTISYIPVDRLTTQGRIERLQSWGFRCLCHQCTMRDYLADESDHRIEVIGGLQNELKSVWSIIKEQEQGTGTEDGMKIDFHETHAKLEYLITLLQQERLLQTLSRTYLIGARLLSRATSTSTSEPKDQPPLSPAQIYIILRYISIATDSGLAIAGTTFGAPYNELIKIEQVLQLMLVKWDSIRAGEGK